MTNDNAPQCRKTTIDRFDHTRDDGMVLPTAIAELKEGTTSEEEGILWLSLEESVREELAKFDILELFVRLNGKLFMAMSWERGGDRLWISPVASVAEGHSHLSA